MKDIKRYELIVKRFVHSVREAAYASQMLSEAICEHTEEGRQQKLISESATRDLIERCKNKTLD